MIGVRKNIWLYCLLTIFLSASSCGEQDKGPNYNLVKAKSLSFLNQDFDVINFKSGKVKLRLFWKNKHSGLAYSSFDALKSDLEAEHINLLFATNAGIFSRDFTPGGLHIENGVQLSPLNFNEGAGNFHMMPNGVFLIAESGPRVIETTEYANSGLKPILATQSGPMLVIHGKIHPTFNEGSSNKYIRSGVGVTEAGELFFAISKKPVNFHDFARLFKEQLNCPDALYLDGAISRFYAPQLGLTDGTGQFVGILGAVQETGAGAQAAN